MQRCLPVGLPMRLRPSFDTSAFSEPTKPILISLQRHGLTLADNGIDWVLSGDSDDVQEPLMNTHLTDLVKTPGSDFEAVDTGPLSTAGL